MSHSIPVGLATIVVAGAAAQWLGWRLRLPAILLLLVFGFLAGPEVADLVDPDKTFGPLLLPLVSLSVAILLFEGALTLHLSELGESRAIVGKLITLGAAVTWILSAFFAHLLLDLDWTLSVLVGAILMVTGPTVVLPLLRQVRPTGRAGSILKWEGILIDPVGAVLAVLVFEAILAGGVGQGVGLALKGILETVFIGGGIGVVGALLFIQLLKRYWIPDRLQAPLALAFAVGAYALANHFQHEGGLLTVTLMGAILANQKQVDVRHILEFKENLRVLLISSLFILLAARVRVEELNLLDLSIAGFIVALVLVVRPLSVLACTLGSDLEKKSALFVAGLAPRGVVAAAITSVFALRLEAEGFPGAARLVPIVFMVIVGTVAIYGLGAGPLAYRLGLAAPQPQGVLMVGAHRFARELATALEEQGLRCVLVDTNALNIARSRMAGLEVYHGSALSDVADEEIDLAGIGRLFAMTPNDMTNALCAIHYAPLFGRGEVYQFAMRSEAPARHLRGRVLFAEGLDYAALDERIAAGTVATATPLAEEQGLDRWLEEHGEDALPLVAVENGRLITGTVDQPLAPAAGQILIGLVDGKKQ